MAVALIHAAWSSSAGPNLCRTRADRRAGPQGYSASIRLCPAACAGPVSVAARAR